MATPPPPQPPPHPPPCFSQPATLTRRKTSFRSRPSSLLFTALAWSFHFLHCTFYDHKAHVDKLTSCCCCCLACSISVDARQARPLLEFPRSCEQSQQSGADASGLLICDFSGTAKCYFLPRSFIYLFFLRRSPCVPFHGCVWKLLHLLANQRLLNGTQPGFVVLSG